MTKILVHQMKKEVILLLVMERVHLNEEIKLDELITCYLEFLMGM